MRIACTSMESWAGPTPATDAGFYNFLRGNGNMRVLFLFGEGARGGNDNDQFVHGVILYVLELRPAVWGARYKSRTWGGSNQS
jgi:hypothetical protein